MKYVSLNLLFMKKKLLFTFVSAAMVSFAAYSSLQSNENVSFSELAMENAEALATGEDPCPWGCLAEYGFCVCYGDHPLKEAKPSEEETPPGD